MTFSVPRLLRAVLASVTALSLACGDDEAKPDRTPPAISIITPVGGATVVLPIVVSGVVTDSKGRGERPASGVASVTVAGQAADFDPEGGAFTATVTELALGAAVIEVVATDVAGNVGSAQVAVTVDGGPLIGFFIEPFGLVLRSVGATATLTLTGIYGDDRQRPITSGAAFESSDPGVVTVDGAGVVSAVAEGTALVKARVGGIEETLAVAVQLDSEPPSEPDIVTYVAETPSRVQGWMGFTEPRAKLVVSGAAAPVEMQADDDGRFTAEIALVPATLNPIEVTVTDADGNSATYEFPIRQNDAAPDRGMLHVSFGRDETTFGAELVGLEGEVLPHPLMVRATDNRGAPLTGTDVEFIVIGGAGALSATSAEEAVASEAERVIARTDSEGYARAFWRLGLAPLPQRAMARLPGDTGLPVIYDARVLVTRGGQATLEGAIEDEHGIGAKDLEVTLSGFGVSTRTDMRGEFVMDLPERVFTSPALASPGSSGRAVTLLVNQAGDGGGARFTRNAFPVTVFPGMANRQIGALNLPRLPEGVALALDGDGRVTTAVTLEHDGGTGFATRLHVPVGTLVTWPPGLPADRRRLALIQVPINSTPMPMPDGYFTSYIVGVQPGGTLFDPPLPIEVPNFDGHPPGAEIDLRSWDHVMARYVDSGTAVVSEDGTYLVSVAGAGVRMAAWHGATRDPPCEPCFVNATVVTPGKKGAPGEAPVELPEVEGHECFCEVNGVPAACPPGKEPTPDEPGTTTTLRVPCGCNVNGDGPAGGAGAGGGGPTPDKPKVEVKCKKKAKGIFITSPAKKSTHPPDKNVAFTAHCEDGESDAQIQWTAARATLSTSVGPSTFAKWDEPGVYKVTASGSTDTCKGSDSVVVEVVECVKVGKIQLCAKEIEETASGQFTLKDGVKAGLVGGPVFLGLGDHATADQTLATAEGTGIVGMHVKWKLLGDADLELFRGPWTIDASAATMRFGTLGDLTDDTDLIHGPADVLTYRLGAWFILNNQNANILNTGLGFTAPRFRPEKTFQATSVERIQGCDPEPPSVGDEGGAGAFTRDEERCLNRSSKPSTRLRFEIPSFSILTDKILPGGRFTIGAQPGETILRIGKVGISKLQADYDASTDAFALEIKFLLGKTGGVAAKGVIKGCMTKRCTLDELSVKRSYDQRVKIAGVTFIGRPMPAPPGDEPILTPAPKYLQSVKLGVKKLDWAWGEAPSFPQVFGEITGTIGPAFNPPIADKIHETELSFASGTGSFTLDIYPKFKLSLTAQYEYFHGVIDALVGPLGLAPLSTTVGQSEVDSIPTTASGLLRDQVDLELTYPTSVENLTLGASLRLRRYMEFAAGLFKFNLDAFAKVAYPTQPFFELRSEVNASVAVPRFRVRGKEFGGQSLVGIHAGFFVQVDDPKRPVMKLEAAINLAEVQGLMVLRMGDRLTGQFLTLAIEGTFKGVGTGPAYLIGGPPPSPSSAPSIDPMADAQSIPIESLPVAFDVARPVEALQVHLVFDPNEPEGPVCDLELPDGRVIGARDEPDTLAAEPALFFEGMAAGQSWWLLFDAPAGTYRLVACSNGELLRGVTVSQAGPVPTVAFEEPFARDEDTVTIRWNAGPLDPTATLSLYWDTDRQGLDGTRFATLEGEAAAGPATLDLTTLPAGPIWVYAIFESDAREVSAYAGRPILVRRGGLAGPGLVRVEPDQGAAKVSWLSVPGATGYAVSAIVVDADGDETTIVTTQVPGDRTGAVLAGVPATGYFVEVAADADGGTSAATRVAVGEPPGRTAIESVVAVGRPWRRLVPSALTASERAVLVADSPRVTLEGDVLSWTPSEGDVGVRGVVVRALDDAGGAREVARHLVHVVPEGQIVAPQMVVAPPTQGVLDQALRWEPDFETASGVPAVVTLVDGPRGAAIEDGALLWVPSADEVVQAGGVVSFLVRAVDPEGGPNTPATEVGFAIDFGDADADGLPDDWELASGLDPEEADDPDADPDQDGLSHATEVTLGTRGDQKDTDGDGLDDAAERALGSDGRSVDSDLDGLIDGAEAALGGDPTVADSDGDGVPDGVEAERGTPVGEVPEDGDGDGLSDDEEARLGSDPAVADSDGDGCSDGEEQAMGTAWDARDSDSDGASDCDEQRVGTDPRSATGDGDHDGLSDHLELVLGTNPTRGDSDEDGFEDGVEVFMATSPTDATSRPEGEGSVVEVDQIFTGASRELELSTAQMVDAGVIYVILDEDNDGAIDSLEMTWSYDPRDPSDGDGDEDGDGIPMWRESRLGTNPRAVDTDGDGASDLDELRAGSDPLDPESVPAAGPVTALTVYPPRAGIVSNTLFGAGRLQVRVVGRRADGTSEDLTAAVRGTSYGLDPAAAGVVTPDGRVDASTGYEGPAALAIANGVLAASVPLQMTLFTPGPVATLALPGPGGALDADGSRLVVAVGEAVFAVDIAVPSAPVLGGAAPIGGAIRGLVLRGALAAAASEDGVTLVDVEDPAAPDAGDLIALAAPSTAIAFIDTRLAVATEDGLVIVDPSRGQGSALFDANGDGRDDRVLQTFFSGVRLAAVGLDGTRLVAASDDGRLYLLRTTATSVIVDGQVSLPAGRLTDLVVRANVAYVARAEGGVARVSLGSPGGITASDTSVNTIHIAARGDLLLAANQVLTRPLAFYATSLADTMPLLGSVEAEELAFGGLDMDMQFYYATGASGRLEVGQHSLHSDVLGVAPRVTPISPAPGATLPEGARVTFEVSALDDVAVTEVALTLDGDPIATLTDAPWRTSFRLPAVAADTPLVLGASALDPGNNVGVMDELALTVTPVTDTTPPSGSFRTPSQGALVVTSHPTHIELDAYDDYAVSEVRLVVGGEVLATLHDAPWRAAVLIPQSAAGPDRMATITAEVEDYGGNVARLTREVEVGGVDLVASGVSLIAADDTSWDGQRVIIQGGTVAIDGAHTFVDLAVGPGGVLTHSAASAAGGAPPLHLTLDRFIVARDGLVDLTGKGYLGDCAAGDPSCGSGAYEEGNLRRGHFFAAGGSHGGVGGGGSHGTWGQWRQPTSPGGGGHYGSGGGEPGGNGGGRIRVEARRVTLDGIVRADGAAAPSTVQANGGGGAGGSVWVAADVIVGAGRIEANGGAGADNGGGPGGGGRIALFADDASGFDVNGLVAWPGPPTDARQGGAGTVYREIAGASTLVVDDGGRSRGVDNRPLGWAASATPIALGDLVVRGASRLVLVAPLDAGTVRVEGRGVLTHLETDSGAEHGLTITAARIEIGREAAVDVTGRGYLGDCSPGHPSCGSGAYTLGNVQGGARQLSGGSHGGVGGGARPNPTYGDYLAPVTLGAGGGYGAGGGEPGGDGGGRIHLVADALVLDGVIRADGADAQPVVQQNGSGGAGGAIWIETGTITGSGEISADGGDTTGVGALPGANGGGGRIAIEYTAATFDFAGVRAWPGGGEGPKASAGTVFLREHGETGRLVIDDGGLGDGDGRALAFAPSDEPEMIDGELILRGTTRLALSRALVVEALVLEGRAVLTHLETDASYEGGLAVTAERVTIGPDAAIDVTGRGYLGDCSPGHPSCGGGPYTLGNVQGGRGGGSGGSHGGLGGSGGAPRPYGDPWAPTTLGGGGNYGAGGGEPGGDGGGRIRIVAQRVEVEGAIRADGAAGIETIQRNGSGGAGGSVFITTQTLAGGGTISADGGDTASAGAPHNAGGGGGGRIAIGYTAFEGFDPARQISAVGGSTPGLEAFGGAGTIVLDGASGIDRLVVDNGGHPNLNETAPWVEIGLVRVEAVTADGVQVAGSPWLGDTLAGSEVVIAGKRFIVSDNTSNTLALSGDSLAGLAPGQAIRGAHDARGALEIRGAARVACDDEVHAAELAVRDGAVLTHHAAPHGAPEPGLTLIVEGTLEVGAGASIDVTARGYLGDCQAGDPACGNGAHALLGDGAAHQASGGSHGGLGGGDRPGYVYGDPTRPATLGGGGGYGSGGGEPGGRGGGRVRIEAGRLVIDGAVRAIGEAGLNVIQANGGGGAGGSIWIDAGALGGAGAIDASGGAGGPAPNIQLSAGGGGGRVALRWDADIAGDVFDSDAIDVHGGAAVSPFINKVGGAGTVFLQGPSGPARLVVDNAEVVHPNECAPWPEVGLRVVTAAASDRVTVADAGWIPDAYAGYEVVFGALATRHTIVSNTADTLVLQASDGNVSGTVGAALRAYYVLDGRLELHGASRVALVDRLSALALEIAGDAVLTHPPTLGGQPEQGLWVELSGALALADDGHIDVSERGLRGDCQPGDPSCGNGGHWRDNEDGGARQLSGGSFGGLGGGPQPNAPYGDPLETWRSGAGGGYGNGGGDWGGSGGGRIHLDVASLALGGRIAADGRLGNGLNAGGGAGGGIWIRAGQLTGAGTISARGADGQGPNGGGAGGGGRVHIDAPGSAGTPDVSGGLSPDPTRHGSPGTSVRD